MRFLFESSSPVEAILYAVIETACVEVLEIVHERRITLCEKNSNARPNSSCIAALERGVAVPHTGRDTARESLDRAGKSSW